MKSVVVSVSALLALAGVCLSLPSPFNECAHQCAPSITLCSQKSQCPELVECVLSTPRHSTLSLHSLLQTCSYKLAARSHFTLPQLSLEAAAAVVSCLWKSCLSSSSSSSSSSPLLSSVNSNEASSVSLRVGLQDTPLNTCGDKCTDAVVPCSSPKLLGCMDIVRCALAVPRTSAISLRSSVAACSRQVHLRSNQLDFDENKLAAAAFAVVSCSRRACPLSSDEMDEPSKVKTSHSLVNPAILFPPGLLGGVSTNEASLAAPPLAGAPPVPAVAADALRASAPLLNMNMCGGLCTSQALQCAQPSMLGCPEIVQCVESSTPQPTPLTLTSTLTSCAHQVHLRSNQLEFDEQKLSEVARAVLECKNRWCPPQDIDNNSDSDMPPPPSASSPSFSSPCTTRRTMATCSCQFYELPVTFCWAPLACREACGGRMDSACTLNEGDGQHYCQCCPVNL